MSALVVLALQPAVLSAHPGSDERLAEISEQIEAQPETAALYLKRGDLHGVDGHWAAALADYDRAARYAPSLDAVDLARGELFLKAGQPEAARRFLDGFLSKRPDHARARLARARTLARLGRGAEAAADFSRAIALLPAIKPDYYLERAQALVAAGNTDEAVQGLDEGLQRLGPLPVLQRHAIDIERQRGRYDAALQRVDRLAAQPWDTERWLALRGDILTQAGRTVEAHAAYAEALAALSARPITRRETAAARELEGHIRTALAERGTGRNSPVESVRSEQRVH